MNPSSISPKIIELSKEIAKCWKMEMYEGCWIYDDKNDELFMTVGKYMIDKRIEYDNKFQKPNHITFGDPSSKMRDCIPIPSISDALEKLRELGWDIKIKHYQINSEWQVLVYLSNIIKSKDAYAPTEHEALLSALLEVLKGESSG